MSFDLILALLALLPLLATKPAHEHDAVRSRD